MEFVFAQAEELDTKNLRQGDLLIRNDALRAAIAQAHSYYAEAPDYGHFLVLTQSCDLVRRGAARAKAPYITLAAARPLDVLIKRRIIDRYRFRDFDFPLVVCDKMKEVRAQQLLERLLHNTEDGVFFIRKGSTPTITHDLCVFLPLSIAMRAEHYDACLSAKIAQLDEIFAAKVGWLAGNQYSRVATPDIEEHVSDPAQYKRDFLDEVLYQSTAWVSAPQLKYLKKLCGEWVRKNPGVAITPAVAADLLSSVPDGPSYVAERAVEILANAKLINRDDPQVLQQAKLLLGNDVALRRLIHNAASSVTT